jgi:hypothetical protein
LFAYTTVGSIFVYGPQNNLQLVPLVLLGNLISTFIWVSLLFAVGSITKNTIITVLVALGLFLSLFIALPIVSVFAGPSSSLNYAPGSGAGGSMLVDNKTITISTGTDNIGVNIGIVAPMAFFPFSGMRDSFFGSTSGYNDIMDFTGGNRPNQPIIQYYNNVFVGASDDILDLPALVEPRRAHQPCRGSQ